MSAIAENLRRQRLPLLTVIAVVVLGAVAWVLISRTTADHLTNPSYPSAAAAVEQVKWEIDYKAEGRFGKLSKAQLAAYATQKEKVGALVEDIYDGIFLDPARLDELVKQSFSADAARSFDAKKLGFPPGATEVTATERSAHIALDSGTADFAISRVTIVAEATVEEKTVTVEHESTLWLERSDGWKVIAFDLEQGPAK